MSSTPSEASPEQTNSSATPDLPQHYDAHAAHAQYYAEWEKAGYFTGDPSAPGKPYSIVIPPPNVTGSLHMGHALNNTLQDVLVRYHRMNGENVVWIPGTDHASIAVHYVVERQLRKEGTDRFALGREKFLERAWEFKHEAEKNIINQLRTLGVSCDWSRQRFTLDPGLTAAVREAFVRLYEDGLIYRAERLINWDPVAQTTVSDLEVIHDEGVKAELWQFAYPLADGSGEIVAATTRPETMLGDTAVAVHPDDVRYQHLIGQSVRHPLVNRLIPIIADAVLVDPAFGTGVVKITPGHDHNDFAVGLRHKLPMINILNKDGTINHEGGEFAGMDRMAARDAVKAKMAELGLDRGSQEHKMNIGRSERSGAILEPMLSTQWFVRMKPLAAPALAAVENNFTRFVPEQWANTYYAWLREIRDWCISRQLWWGHQIPAWHCAACKQVTVLRDTPSACGHCGSEHITQDTDILDTWFSSALWPFSTMGWPEKTAELATWYPTAVLTTGFDIIFFWVARMMMFGQYFMGHVPFHDVYIHALIRDSDGEKMSKTKGNVVDPLAMINTYGCDAFRFTLVAFAAQGRDVRWDENRAAGYNKFCNKIWQAFRFVMFHAQTAAPSAAESHTIQSSASGMAAPTNTDAVPHAGPPVSALYARWITHRLRQTIAQVRTSIESYRFNDAASAVYSFIWDDFCDWYLELSKITFYSTTASDAEKAHVRSTLVHVFDVVARLVHPFMPFLSEEIWQRLPNTTADAVDTMPTHGARTGTLEGATRSSVMLAAYPTVDELPADDLAAHEVAFVQHIITAIRRVRAEFGVLPKAPIDAWVRADAHQLRWLQHHDAAIKALAKATLTVLAQEPPKHAATEVVQGAEVIVPLEGLIDFAVEAQRLAKELQKTEKDIERVNKQLTNQDFMSRAPDDIVADKKEQLANAEQRRARLQDAIARLT